MSFSKNDLATWFTSTKDAINKKDFFHSDIFRYEAALVTNLYVMVEIYL